MSAQENAERIRTGYDAFNKGDIETLTGLFAPDAKWHVPGRSAMAGDYKDRDTTFAYFGQLAERTDGTMRANLESLVAEGDTVVARQTNTATRGGKALDEQVCLVFELRNGRIVQAREYHYDLYEADEFWS